MVLNRKQNPKYNNIEHINFPKVEKVKLDNGAYLYTINGSPQDILKLDVTVGAGSIYADKKLIAPITSMMLNEGTNSKKSYEISEMFDYYGAYSQAVAEKDTAFCGLVSLNKHIDKTLPLFYEIMTDSIFPQKELDITLTRQKQQFVIDMEKTSFISINLFLEKLFGEHHPYGNSVRVEDYSNITRQELLDFYKSYYYAGNYNFILSGNVLPKDIELVNKYFGQNKILSKQQLPKIEEIKTQNQDVFVVKKPDAVQSSIRMGLITVNRYHKDYAGLLVLSTIYGGYFGSRLMKNIREDKGYTYGIYATQTSLQNAGFLVVSTDVKVENTKEAIEEIKREMQYLCDKEVQKEELDLVRNYMMGEMIQMFDGPFAISESFKSVFQYNMGFEYFEYLRETILTITSQQLKDLAIKYFDVAKLTTVVVGNL
jgi:predicted Zn-dependent peptidase